LSAQFRVCVCLCVFEYTHICAKNALMKIYGIFYLNESQGSKVEEFAVCENCLRILDFRFYIPCPQPRPLAPTLASAVSLSKCVAHFFGSPGNRGKHGGKRENGKVGNKAEIWRHRDIRQGLYNLEWSAALLTPKLSD